MSLGNCGFWPIRRALGKNSALVCEKRQKKVGKIEKMLGGKLMTIIGDEDTVTGFLMGGIGELNKERHPNFLVNQLFFSRLFFTLKNNCLLINY
jgi:hypothetical protein